MPHNLHPTPIIEELRQVTSILAGLQAEMPAGTHLSLSLSFAHVPDAEKIRLVDLFSTTLLGRPGMSLLDSHCRHGQRGELYLSVFATLTEPSKRLAAVEADNKRLRALLGERVDTETSQ